MAGSTKTVYKDDIDLVAIFRSVNDVETQWTGIGFAVCLQMSANVPRVQMICCLSERCR